MNKEIIYKLKEECKDRIIVAATKYIGASDMRALFSYGIKDFGENRVDVMLKKMEELKDLEIIWHFIGHLQTNKVKKMINKIDYLHSLDSIHLAEVIDKERLSPLNTFIELKLVDNENKSGVTIDKLDSFMVEIKKYKNINVVGFMVMADRSDEESIRKVFKKAKELKEKYHLKYLSMGMSDDYKIALEEGTTHLRIGRLLFN